MKRCAPIAAAVLATAMAGCIIHGKQNAVTPPVPVPAAAVPAKSNEPLSLPQTHVQLPPAQPPLDPDALDTQQQPTLRNLPPATQTPSPVVTPRRTPVTASTPPKPDPPEPAPPAVTEPPRPSIQELLPESKQNQLKEAATANRKQVRAWLDAHSTQRFTGQAKQTRDTIQSLLKASEEAERRGEFPEAAQLAERAFSLLKGLPGGR